MGVVRAAQIAGVLCVCRNAVQVVLSFPIGAMADRVGHARALGGGYVVGATTALLTALAFWYDIKSVSMLVGVFLLVGLYVAVQYALDSGDIGEVIAIVAI